MTEYWVSQGNKWCDFCKIYISNNPLSIRTHELGQRHKENVTKRIATMQKESAAKEKELKEAARAVEQIEDKANRSYQKDLASFKEANSSNKRNGESSKELPIKFYAKSREWEYDAASGYYYNLANGYYYDSNSALYYSNAIGKWVKEEEAFPPYHASSVGQNQLPTGKPASKLQGGPASGPAISTSLGTAKSVKGATSSVAAGKRKRADEKPKVVSKEEEAALEAREAARKRVEEREKHLLGLYKSY